MGVLIKLRDCESLSPAEAQVRDTIVEDPRAALSFTVYELAEASYTSPSTRSSRSSRPSRRRPSRRRVSSSTSTS